MDISSVNHKKLISIDYILYESWLFKIEDMMENREQKLESINHVLSDKPEIVKSIVFGIGVILMIVGIVYFFKSGDVSSSKESEYFRLAIISCVIGFLSIVLSSIMTILIQIREVMYHQMLKDIKDFKVKETMQIKMESKIDLTDAEEFQMIPFVDDAQKKGESRKG